MARQPTRSQVIAAFIGNAVLTSRMTWNQYADAVVRHYHASVDVIDRVVEFHVATTAENFEHATRLNTQTVRRILIGEISMRVDLEESLVAALPPEARDRLLSLLLQRQGLLLARRPAGRDGLSAQLGVPCELLRSAASAVERIAPMMADGNGIGPEDAHLFADAQHALDQVQGACITLSAQIADATGKVPAAPAAPAVVH